MYVDESGDCGLCNSPTRYFVLSGIVLHELRWQSCLNQLLAFRQRMRDQFGLKSREELRASALINPALCKAASPRDPLGIVLL